MTRVVSFLPPQDAPAAFVAEAKAIVEKYAPGELGLLNHLVERFTAIAASGGAQDALKALEPREFDLATVIVAQVYAMKGDAPLAIEQEVRELLREGNQVWIARFNKLPEIAARLEERGELRASAKFRAMLEKKIAMLYVDRLSLLEASAKLAPEHPSKPAWEGQAVARGECANELAALLSAAEGGKP